MGESSLKQTLRPSPKRKSNWSTKLHSIPLVFSVIVSSSTSSSSAAAAAFVPPSTTAVTSTSTVTTGSSSIPYVKKAPLHFSSPSPLSPSLRAIANEHYSANNKSHVPPSCTLSLLSPSSSLSSSSSLNQFQNQKQCHQQDDRIIKSFISIPSISQGKISLGSLSQNQNRYGGRSNTYGNVVTVVDHINRQIHFHPVGDKSSSSDRSGVLGFDLKMVSQPSIEENCDKSEQGSNSRNRRNNQNSMKSRRKKEQRQHEETNKSNGRVRSSGGNQQSRSRSSHGHGNWIGIDTLDTSSMNMSPLKKQIASNLLQSRRYRRSRAAAAAASVGASNVNTASGRTREHGNDPTSSSSSSLVSRTNVLDYREGKGNDTGVEAEQRLSSVPMWFPYIPTRQQIESLKVVELKDACNERGLAKTGNKLDLQQRLLQWTHDQHKRRVLERNALRMSTAHPLHDAIDQALHSNSNAARSSDSFDSYLSSSFDAFSSASAAAAAADPSVSTSRREQQKKQASTSPPSTLSKEGSDSDSVDTIEPLINRRKALLRSKQFSFSKNKKGVLGFDIGSDTTQDDSLINTDDEDEEEEEYDELFMLPTKDYLSGLTKTFHDSKSVPSVESQNTETEDVDVMNNYELKELYLEAKYADQKGDAHSARMLLEKLHRVTPNDTRVIRRLARLEMQENHFHRGREILQTGLRLLPNDAYLLHGLGQLERKCGNLNKARDYFKEAIQASPKIPNPYHALGTLEHSQGNIRAATTVLRMGLKQCPSNHRLHHALGDLYREAKMLDMAEKAYLRGLKCLDMESSSTGRPLNWSRSFFYTAMSYLSYDRDDKTAARKWLQKSINLVNKKMHSQGWLGLAQLEESEGNIDSARKTYLEGLNFYEKYRGIKKVRASSRSMLGGRYRGQVRPAKLGDKWLSVYESFARLEERYGDYASANNVYSRAATAFPNNWNILFSWSQLQRKHGRFNDRSRTLLELACGRAGRSDSEPYRLYAEFEMSMGNYNRARSILFLGAQSYSESSDGSLNNDKFARLYHTWAICEWHLMNLDRAEVLFDHSLRLTEAGISGSKTRALIFLSIARFLFHARQEYSLAQHCVSLSLTEDTRLETSWLLWSKLANVMGNDKLSQACKNEIEKLKGANAKQDKPLSSVSHQSINQLLRRAPWQHKIINMSNQDSWYEANKFPDNFHTAKNLP
eukprot:CAMPEP_0203669648 /NCGR_PEP_ID=MMETSP0090-20130426/5949_1 /ASSEMBLY_ACC=CAM_ASM_001088 /TAXON_ID=426623 /ORGANISM="Chaetoceros affinis, Strain CCMP159" /LENGTH=1189 /DNA_ID=CAMNT_0050534373 /DNA_START=368 /DNA_END=3937 /DNA_ORIENTATION=+